MMMMMMKDFKCVIEIQRYFKLLAKILGDCLWIIHKNSTCRERQSNATKEEFCSAEILQLLIFKTTVDIFNFCNVAQKSLDNV